VHYRVNFEIQAFISPIRREYAENM